MLVGVESHADEGRDERGDEAEARHVAGRRHHVVDRLLHEAEFAARDEHFGETDLGVDRARRALCDAGQAGGGVRQLPGGALGEGGQIAGDARRKVEFEVASRGERFACFVQVLGELDVEVGVSAGLIA